MGMNLRRMLKEESEIPVEVRRRVAVIDNVINIMLLNMSPCDYNSADHFV